MIAENLDAAVVVDIIPVVWEVVVVCTSFFGTSLVASSLCRGGISIPLKNDRILVIFRLALEGHQIVRNRLACELFREYEEAVAIPILAFDCTCKAILKI